MQVKQVLADQEPVAQDQDQGQVLVVQGLVVQDQELADQELVVQDQVPVDQELVVQDQELVVQDQELAHLDQDQEQELVARALVVRELGQVKQALNHIVLQLRPELQQVVLNLQY